MDSEFRVTISQVPSGGTNCETEWKQLVEHVEQNHSDLVVLPEMPFYRWLPASNAVDPAEWDASVEAHDEWLTRLEALTPAVVASSRPVVRDGTPLNEGFVWSANTGYRPVHHKAYLPDEKGFWEASWYDAGPSEFSLVEVTGLSTGFLICTELWAMEQVRAYGRKGVQLIISPRATGAQTSKKWLAAGRTAAVVAGAFSVSANRAPNDNETPEFGGQSWCFGPDGGRLALTSEKAPFRTVTINPSDAEKARETYPRYAIE